MGKSKQRQKKINPNKNKFIIIVVAAAIAIGIFAIVFSNPLPSDDVQNKRLTIDTRNGSPVLGSDVATITIIEFGDYQCPFCQKWNQSTKPIIEKNYIDTGKVNLIFVDFPIVGPDSLKAHAGSYCAQDQNLYWQYHDFLYTNQGHENSGWVRSPNLKTLVEGIDGLDVDLFSKCLDSGKYENRVKDNQSIASKSGVRSTPSFIVIGPDGHANEITGAQPYQVFQKIIDDLLV